MDLSEIILIYMGLLTLAIFAAGLFRNRSIPFTVLLVVIGMGIAEWSRLWHPLHVLGEFTLTPELVFFVFLPTLIFESGLSLNARQLLKDLIPVLTLAIPALLISTTLVGLGIWLLLDIDLTIALLFGALISATDPVAVVALFKELGAPLRLNVLVEGESLFNDATAIVVFGILLAMVMEGSSLSVAGVGGAVVEFLWVFLGGVVVGLLIGIAVSEMLFHLKSNISSILTMSIVSAYASFILAEHLLHVSGVMATVTAAITLSVYGLSRLTIDVKPVLSETWEFLALVANALLFLLVGLSIDTAALLSDIGVILLVVLVVLLVRAITVYSMVPLTVKMFHLPRVSWAERHIMWWGGLKGGLAIAIALSIPESLPGRDFLINLTLGVVLYTLLVNAWSIRPLMHRLKLDILDEDELAELNHELTHAGLTSSQLIDQYRSLGILSHQLGEKLNLKIQQAFNSESESLELTPRQARRRVYLYALKTELDTLAQLHGAGVIDQYTLLDIKHTLQIDRETYNQYENKPEGVVLPKKESPFVTFENWVLKTFREKNWAIKFLSNYQSKRLSQRIQRNIAGVVMSNNVIERLKENDQLDEAEKSRLIELYQQRLDRRRFRLQQMQDDFSEMYSVIENRIFSQAALMAAKAEAEYEYHHGEIGIKAYNQVSQVISKVLEELDQEADTNDDAIADTICNIPLFQGLSQAAISALCRQMQTVTFLAGDIIISEGSKGDALYILKSGIAEASHLENGEKKVLGPIISGEFFGEVALLSNQVRTATVTATSTVKTYRLIRKDVLAVAKTHGELKQRLEQAKRERLEEDDSATGAEN